VTDPAAVRDVLRRYDTYPPLEVVYAPGDTSGKLVRNDDEDNLDQWPSAVPVDELPAYDVDDEDWLDALDELHEAQGQRGLTALLSNLAPYLSGPLTLQAAEVSSIGDFLRAKQWTVLPGSTAVEYREIVGFGNDPAEAVGKPAA
jgi:hypothetical protein